MAAAMAGIGRS